MIQKLKNWLSISDSEPENSFPHSSALPPLREDPLTRLIEALKTNDANRRVLAAQALGELGGDAFVAIPQLVLAAAAAKKDVRAAAREALPKIDPAWTAHPGIPEFAAPDLVKKLDSSVPESAKAAADLIARIGNPCVPALVEALKNATPETHVEPLVKSLGKIGAAASEAEPVLQALFQRSENPLVREAILLAFSKMNLSLETLQPTLLAALHDEQSEAVRRAALEVVASAGSQEMQSAAPVFIEKLASKLADKDENLRERAHQILTGIGNPAVLPLLKMLENRHSARTAAAGKANQDMSDFYQRLQTDRYRWAEDLKSSFDWHRHAALEKLVRCEQAHLSALEVLLKIGLDESCRAEATPVFQDLSADGNPVLRGLAAQWLEGIDAGGKFKTD